MDVHRCDEIGKVLSGWLAKSCLVLCLRELVGPQLPSSEAAVFVCAVVFAHASFRTPNLKARLNSFREEFRKVWSEYSEA